MAQWPRIPAAWLVTPLILLFFFLALDSLVDDTPTMDEQNHIARGLAFLRTGDPRLSLEHPPLVNALSALPLLMLPDVRLPTDHPSWQRQPPDAYWYIFASLFLWQYNHDVTRMVFLARMPIVFLTLALALAGYHAACRFWGRAPAFLASALLLFEPNILAHGRYATTDVGGTTFVFLAAFFLWRLWQVEGWAWQRWLWAGLSLGLAFGSKLSTLGFVPVFALLALLPLYGRSPAKFWSSRGILSYGRAAGLRLLQLGSAGLLSLLVIWAIFGFEWGTFHFRSGRLQSLNTWQGPMPTFWSGIDQIVNVSEGGRPAFLLGQFSSEGFPNYFPVAFAVKTPLPVLLLLPLAAVLLLAQKRTRARAIFLLLPPLLYFLLSLQSALNIGYRHLLPMLPFLLVLISGLANRQVNEPLTEQVTRRPNHTSRFPFQLPPSTLHVSRFPFHVSHILSLLPALVAIALLIADFIIHPHYLSYFNALAGGPTQGYNILIDSNVDWGQDLLRLQRWMADNGVAEVKLGWFGTADPDYYGLKYQPMPGFPLPPFYSQWTTPPFNTAAPEPGIYAISVSSLWELPLAEKNVYPWFRAQEPVARVGYSILIYDVR